MFRIIALMILISLNGFSLDDADNYREEPELDVPGGSWAVTNDQPFSNHLKKKPLDIHADRPDIAGFKEKPVVFFLPFWKELEAVHPKYEGDRGDGNVIVLELDELAASGSAGSSEGAVIGESILLAGSGVLAFWFGTKSSIEVIISTTKELEELGREKKELMLALSEARIKNMSRAEKRRIHENIVAMLTENKQNRNENKFSRVMMGVVPAIGGTMTGVSAFLQVPAYATVSMAAAGALGMAISGPIISVFAVSAAAKHGYHFYKTFPAMNKLDKIMAEPMNAQEAIAYGLLKERLELTRILTATSGTSMIGLTIGVPATIFGGPLGLIALIPATIGGIAGGYFQDRKLGYAPQLSWQDKLQIDGHDGLINAIGFAHQEYSLLKKMKSEQRILYPIGKSAPFPFKTFATGIAKLRKLTEGTPGYLTAEQTFFAYLKEHNALDIQAALITKSGIDEKYTQFSSRYSDRNQMSSDELLQEEELLKKQAAAAKDLDELRLEETLLLRALTMPLSDDESVFLMVRHMVKNNLFLPFAEGIMNKKSLKKMIKYTGAITKEGDEFHVNANKLVTLMLPDSVLSDVDRKKLRHRLFKLSRDILFITAKNRMQWRERQLLDFLNIRINT